MPNLNESGITLLASVTVDLQAADPKSTIYTVPAGKSLIVTHVIIRNPTASLAVGTDFDLGDGASANTWINTVDLSSMTATTDFMVIEGNNVKYTVFNAGDVFGIIPVTGATADAQATAEIFGYLF